MKPLKIVVFLIALVVSTWIAGLAAFTGAVIIMRPEKPAEHTDAIIVLTGGKNRIETGLDLFSRNLAPNLFITGVHDDVTLAEITSRHAGEKPLPECCIVLGYKASTTFENAAETKEWLGEQNLKTIRLVTSNYHMPRAMLEFHRELPDLDIIANPIMQPDITPTDPYFWHMIFEEYHKTVFRFFDTTVASIT